jgi:DNA (cytosine-5)-methyltransferase 1
MTFTGKYTQLPGVRSPRVLSLFSGAGGLDLGFLNAGFAVIASSDIDEHCCATLCRNKKFFPKKHRVICGSVVDLKLRDLVPDQQVDLMIGGPPCQSFSAAGRRAGGVGGVSDFRGSLFWQYGRLISDAKPRAFVFENVRGILQANQGRDWTLIREHLESLGYVLHWRVLDAAAYGVAQHRERLIVVGTAPGVGFLFPRPLHGPDSRGNRGYISASEAIADLDDPKETIKPFPGKYGHLLQQVPPGENYKFFTEELGHPEPKFAWRSRFSDFLYKADPQHPVRTIVAHQGSYSGPFHWRSRRFTAAEFARLQSFPKDYEFPESHTEAVKQIGNSVAPRFGFHLAKAMGAQLFNIPHEVELLPEAVTLSIDRRKSDKARQTRSRTVRTCVSPNLFDSATPRPSVTDGFQERLMFSAPRSRCIHADEHPEWLNASVRGTLCGGEWNLEFEDEFAPRNSRFRFDLRIVFSKTISGRFSSIVANGDLRSADRFALVWDAAHRLIRRETTFESLQPLYGHFTEPYPKFTLSFEGKDRAQPEYVALYQRLTDFSFSGGMRALSELRGLTNHRDPLNGIKELRKLGWDFRVQQTNRTIPKGMFRSCYPFAIPVDAETFVAWVDIGKHRTADQTAIGALPT